MRKAAGFLFAAALLPAAATAEEKKAGALGIAAGAFDILNDEIIGVVQLEWHFTRIFPYRITAFAGGWITLQEDHYLYGGVQREFNISDRVWFAPSLAIGGYNLRQGKNLGKDLEFQSRLELGYRLNPVQSVALQFAHISNGGLDHSNPGSELLTLSYQHQF